MDELPETTAQKATLPTFSAQESGIILPEQEVKTFVVPASTLLFQAPTPFSAAEAEEPEYLPQAKLGTALATFIEEVPKEPSELAEEIDTETVEDKKRVRRRGGRGKGRGRNDVDDDNLVDDKREDEGNDGDTAEQPVEADVEEDELGTSSRRRRRRRVRPRSSEANDEDPRTEIVALKGSTRLEAKRMRRQEGRRDSRRRQLVTEAEFLSRRESVSREMIIRERDGLNQIAVIEDGLLVEHFVARHTQSTMVGSIYLGRVQNVLPSMEAAFVDLGKGRNAVLYAGEVNWDAVGLEGQPRRIEQALKSGDPVLVQVTKDPIGHKGARLTSQITLAGRYLVLVPSGSMTGISRKLPEPERMRLKKLLREIVPDGVGVIVRTAAEGASEEQLRDDVERLMRQWEEVQKKSARTKNAPLLLRGEPELALRVVRDIFNEDFKSLTVQGEQTWKTIKSYVSDLSPDLVERLRHWESDGDVFAAHRVDEQLAKGMDRKVWLPSGGSLIIDRTEAMTVVDVNTGKFTGAGGTLEETVTKNNIEAAEEIVRQLRLRDIGGIIVIDFVDMVLEANRDLVLRRLIECLGRDRTRHQVTEITSLGLVQMTRKRVGQGLVEAFSTVCECCDGRGFIVHDTPVEKGRPAEVVPTVAPRKRKGEKKVSPVRAVPEDEGQLEKVREKLAAIAAAAASAHEEKQAKLALEAPAAEHAAPRSGSEQENTAVNPEEDNGPVDNSQTQSSVQKRKGIKKRVRRRVSTSVVETGPGTEVQVREKPDKKVVTKIAKKDKSEQQVAIVAPAGAQVVKSQARTVTVRKRRRAATSGPVDTESVE